MAWLYFSIFSIFIRNLTDEAMGPPKYPPFPTDIFEQKRMKVHHKFVMGIEFKSLLTGGILPYAQPKKEIDTDYISLAIVAG